MPVKKFRTVEEMNEPRWRNAGDPELARAIREIWEFGRRTTMRSFPPGVHKHRSIEDAQAQRQLWEDENVRRHLERRSR